VVLRYGRVAAQRKSESEDLRDRELQTFELARRVFRGVSSGPLWSRGSVDVLSPATLSFHLQISHRPSVSLPSIYHNIADYAAPLIPVCSQGFPPFPLSLLPMMHSSHPLPCPLVQWAPSWPDVSAFAKPDPSWFAYPTRRRRLEQAVASQSTSRPLHPHSSRTRAHPHPLRAQVAPALVHPICYSMAGLERECRLYRFGFLSSNYAAS
jgi:hypothetical protein